MGDAIYSEQITKLSSGHGDLRLTIIYTPISILSSGGIFVEDIKAPIQHRYDMSATHAHIDRAEAVNYTQRHPSMTVFLCSSPLHYSPLVYRLLSERERDGHGLQCILEGCFCTDY